MDPLVRSRAVQAVIWGMPAVNFELLREAAAGVGAGDNQVVFWSKLLDWKNQTLTPNPDTLYFFPFYNTQAGPVVLEIPPAEGGSITGSVDNGWQEALEDVGPAGVDKGAGGKYLILPPGFDGEVPARLHPDAIGDVHRIRGAAVQHRIERRRRRRGGRRVRQADQGLSAVRSGTDVLRRRVGCVVRQHDPV
ncbi:DUF1254 domain-containing protein [Mycolicibacterium nivoides]|uniref:DUF1254 domain-containing protein n=1 Tax=Mycolicibacterium nivoides TaxID=2487344 RepID=UPI001F14CDF2|nr:DUF1254 domain-containing protein [Mycolicibacterium nivoides]